MPMRRWKRNCTPARFGDGGIPMFNQEDKVDLDQPGQATVHGCDNRSMVKTSKDQYILEYFERVA